jgi:uncharacterized protein (TIGR03435 family)
MRKGLSVLTVFAGLPAFSQLGDTRPTFEVAAIRRCGNTERGGSLSASPGRLSVPCFGILRLIQDAYQLYTDGKPDFLIQGRTAPVEGIADQMLSYRYSIDAKSESPQTVAMMRGPMMQRLLEDRFHVKIHRDAREVPVYIMTVAKEDSKLKTATKSGCNSADGADLTTLLKGTPGGKQWCGILSPPIKNGTHYVLDERSISLTSFSKIFNVRGLPVIDRTGLTGTFDIHLEWEFSPPDPALSETGGTTESPDTSIVSAFRKELGIELKPGIGPREYLVVDHLEQPSEN